MNTQAINATKPALKVRSAIKAGGMAMNHNTALKVRSAIKAGGFSMNHNVVAR